MLNPTPFEKVMSILPGMKDPLKSVLYTLAAIPFTGGLNVNFMSVPASFVDMSPKPENISGSPPNPTKFQVTPPTVDVTDVPTPEY